MQSRASLESFGCCTVDVSYGRDASVYHEEDGLCAILKVDGQVLRAICILVQGGGAVEQWLDGPSGSRLARNLSDRSTGQDSGAAALSGVSSCPSLVATTSLHVSANLQRQAQTRCMPFKTCWQWIWCMTGLSSLGC